MMKWINRWLSVDDDDDVVVDKKSKPGVVVLVVAVELVVFWTWQPSA
jgi:hypothetical protein